MKINTLICPTTTHKERRLLSRSCLDFRQMMTICQKNAEFIYFRIIRGEKAEGNETFIELKIRIEVSH